MIDTDVDVRIKYNEVEGVFSKNNKNVLVFVEDSSNTKRNEEDTYEISSYDTMSGYIDMSNNGTAMQFASTFFSQSVRPSSFILAALAVRESPAVLRTGNFEDFSSFKTSFLEDQNNYHDIGFVIAQGEELDNDTNFLIPGALLKEMTSFDQMQALLAGQAWGDFVVLNGEDAGKNFLTFRTEDTGAEQKISYMRPLAIDSDPIYFNDSLLITGILSTFDAFKANCQGNNVKITFRDNGETQTRPIEIDLSNIDSWNVFCDQIGSATGNTVTAFYSSYSERLVINGNWNTIDYPKNTDENPDVDFVSLLKMSQASEAIKSNKITQREEFDCTGLMKGTEDLAGYRNDGSDDTTGEAEVLERLNRLLKRKSVNPASIVLSRNLTMQSGRTDSDTLVNYIDGFIRHFRTVNGDAPTSILSLCTDIYKTADASPFKDFSEQNGARCVVLNYHNKISEYLDGAIAAYAAGVNFEGTGVWRNTKGLSFNAVTPDSSIENDIDNQLSLARINCYAKMDNGMSMYRNGLTLSTGDVGYIDTIVGLNAIMKDFKDRLVFLIKNGSLRMNNDGASRIYAALASVCEKYVRNGFLSAMTQTAVDEGGSKKVVIPPYKIIVARDFTDQEISSRNYPDTKVVLASTVFANTISVNINSAYYEL